MISKIILCLAGLFALYWTIKVKKTFPAIITVGMIVGIALALSDKSPIPLYGFHVYMGFTLMAFIYGLVVSEKKIRERFAISLMAGFIFLFWLWVLNHWHGNALLAPILVILISIVAITIKLKLRNELAFLSILAADAIAIIIEHSMK